jgi:hypothetical protein
MEGVIAVEKVKEIFKEMFQTHEASIAIIIAGNTKITNDRLEKLTEAVMCSNNRLEQMEKDYKELKEFVYTSDDITEKKINQTNEKINKIKTILEDDKSEMKKVNDKLREIEDRSRRNNLRFDGVKENQNETWEDSERKISKLLREQLEIKEQIQIERAHRTGPKQTKKDRTIIIKLLNYKDKEKILRNANKLKGSGIFINEDFCKETNGIRSELRKQMKEERQKGKYAFISYDKLIVKDFNTFNRNN